MYLGVHDLGDVISGLIIGIIILYIWHLAVINKTYDSLSNRGWLLVILLFQLTLYLLYPIHDGHEPSIWFLGVMTGWFLGASDIKLNAGKIQKFCVSTLSIVIVFFAMASIAKFESNLEVIGLPGTIYSYALGLIFSILITWILPRLWKLLKLAT